MIRVADEFASKTVCVFYAQGCPRSETDTALIVNFFKANGWKFTNRFEEADLILVATCGFDKTREDISMKHLSTVYRKKRADTPVYLLGCLPGINRHRVESEFKVGIIEATNLRKIDDVIQAKVSIDHVKDPNIFAGYMRGSDGNCNLLDNLRWRLVRSREYFYRGCARIFLPKPSQPLYNTFHNAFNIRISRGCMENCSYCAIRFVQGPLRSKPLEMVRDEFVRGLAEGYDTFRLIAADAGAYGQDVGENIVNLLACLFEYKGHFRLVCDDFHPKWLIKYSSQLLDIFQSNTNRLGYIGIPIQSGSQRILQLMRRDYSIPDLRSSLGNLKQKCEDLKLITHILIGFPGETKEDFNETIDFLREVRFRNIYVFKYSDRPNVPSADLPHKVGTMTKELRLLRFYLTFPTISLI
jgi:tRNA A37 methylthiotransferase MiaB